MKKDKTLIGLYNPNRFNALDGALAFISALLAFELVPRLLSILFKDVFAALYEYDFYAYMIVNIAISQSIIFFVALIFGKIRRADTFDGGGYEAKWNGVQILMSMILIMGIMMTFYQVHLKLGSDGESILGSTLPTDIKLSAVSVLYMPVYLVLISLLPAICEEMLFRGIVMRGAEQFGKIAAVLISATMFALMHGSFSQMLLQFFGGLAIGAVVILTRNWLLGSIMHAFNNIFSFIFGFLTADLYSGIFGRYVIFVVDGACIVIGVVCMIVGTLYFAKFAIKNELNVQESGKARYLSGKRKYAYLDGNGEVAFSSDMSAAKPRGRNEFDGRKFYLDGKFSSLNKTAPLRLSVTFIGLGIVAAITLIII